MRVGEAMKVVKKVGNEKSKEEVGCTSDGDPEKYVPIVIEG